MLHYVMVLLTAQAAAGEPARPHQQIFVSEQACNAEVQTMARAHRGTGVCLPVVDSATPMNGAI